MDRAFARQGNLGSPDSAGDRGSDTILIGDLILLEVLQGARDEGHTEILNRNLRQFTLRPMLDPATAPKVAQNYRRLRDRGITSRKTIDMIIGTFCIEGNHRLLHADRDFDPMEKYLGLRVVCVG